MRLLPTRSINTRAAQVMMKLVVATESDVRVGLEKPSMVKMVAEKYIREFYLSQLRIRKTEKGSYKTTKLLQSLQQASNSQSSPISTDTEQFIPNVFCVG